MGDAWAYLEPALDHYHQGSLGGACWTWRAPLEPILPVPVGTLGGAWASSENAWASSENACWASQLEEPIGDHYQIHF